MLNNLGRALKPGEFAAAVDILAVPLDAKFEVFVGVKTRGIHGKWRHGVILFSDSSG
jgi:hypothetical protein